MDIELARTFLEIVSTGSFIKAADRLHVAQTTVSARVRLLEQQLGRPLFVRNKGGATLTPAGEQFLRFAPTFVQLWQRARQQVAVPEGHRAVLTVGSEVSLWQPLLVEWVRMMRRSHPDIALRVHVDVPQDLITHVAAGLVDIAIMYAPQHRPGLKIDLLMEEELVLVTTDLKTYRANDPQYVHVEWGPEFSLHHGGKLSRHDSERGGQSRSLGPQLYPYGRWFRLLSNACNSALSKIGETPSSPGRASLLFPSLCRPFGECRSCYTRCSSHRAALGCELKSGRTTFGTEIKGGSTPNCENGPLKYVV